MLFSKAAYIVTLLFHLEKMVSSHAKIISRKRSFLQQIQNDFLHSLQDANKENKNPDWLENGVVHFHDENNHKSEETQPSLKIEPNYLFGNILQERFNLLDEYVYSYSTSYYYSVVSLQYSMKQTTPFLRSKLVDMTESVTSNLDDLPNNNSTNIEEHHHDFDSTPSPSILISMMPSDAVVVVTSSLMNDDTTTPSPSSALIDTMSSSVTESTMNNNMDDNSPSPTTMILPTIPFDSVETTSSNILGNNNTTPSPSTVTSMVSSSSNYYGYYTTPSPTNATMILSDSAVEESTSNMLGDNATPSPSSPLTNEMSLFSSSSSSSVKSNNDVAEKPLTNNFPTNAPSSVLNKNSTTNPAPSTSTFFEEIKDKMKSESVGISSHSSSLFNSLNLITICSVVVWILYM